MSAFGPSSPASGSILKLENVTRRFGGLCAVCGFSLEVRPGELVGLIGPNGAGKTTVFNLITGFAPVSSGRIFWRGEDITARQAHQITARGIARTFQNIRLFTDMTVLENVMVSFHCRLRSRFWQAMLGLPGYVREDASIRAKALGYLEEMGLGGVAGVKAGGLPYGMQRRLEIARALATSPGLLLLDEPAAGMNPNETSELAGLIRRLRDRHDLTVLLIEHDMKFVMGLCERIKVLDHGVALAEGSPEQIQNDPEVIKAYLGRGVGAKGG